MRKPVVENPSVFLDLPSVWQRDIFTLLVDPVVHGPESKAALDFQEFDEIGHDGSFEE
jgi:hypothetical protein